MKENIGKYLSRRGYSDVNIIGKIVGVKGKRIYLVQRMTADKQTTKLEFVTGGFSSICLNGYNQEWEFNTSDEILQVKNLKNSRLEITDEPYHYYDYNF